MSTWKKILYFAVVPAIIAGTFSISPKIYDILTSPKASLNYNIIEGPGLNKNGKCRKVLSITVSNTGTLSLKNIQSELILENGIIESSTIQENSGLHPLFSPNGNNINVKIANLHPTEQFTISAMILFKKSNFRKIFNVRSDEVRGTYKSINSDKTGKSKDILGAILATFSVFVMALIMLISMNKGKLLFPLSIIFSNKQNIIYYIIIRNGLNDLCDKIGIVETNFTYLHIADILLSEGEKGDGIYKESSVKALKCLLLIKDIAKNSQNVIANNLKLLEKDKFSNDEISLLKSKSVDVDNPEIRNRIEDFLSNNLKT